tara:strand:- start:6491 stop:10144 length:3654 start_codon:yes stop_codon:yes gene_type:complete
MFQTSDIYTGSGATTVLSTLAAPTGSFPSVTLFTANDVYTADTDNIPLKQLAKRTHYLWERHGFGASGYEGIAFTVSSLATVTANTPNTFTTLSACIAAMPKNITKPILIEVASSANLGRLDLNDIQIEEGGSLEIINRNFSRAYAGGVASPSATAAFDVANDGASFILSSGDVSATLADTSCIDVSTTVIRDAGLPLKGNMYSMLTVPGHLGGNRRLWVCVKAAAPHSSTAFKFDLPTYEANGQNSADASSDISITNMHTGTAIRRATPTDNSSRVTGIVTGNHLNALTVKNCNGPIYIRNFIVDGETTSDADGPTPGSGKIGIDIVNSDVILENCGTMRNTRAGLSAENSKVVISRSFSAYRNYDFSATNHKDLSVSARESAGIKLLNSVLTLSADVVRDHQVSGMYKDFFVNCSRNTNGIVMHNSVIKGGHTRSVLTDDTTNYFLMLQSNVRNGLLANNSKVDVDGRLDIYENSIGMDVYNSEVLLDEASIDANQYQGINAHSSYIRYNKNERKINTFGESTRTQIQFSGNGQHLHLQHGSNFVPAIDSSKATTVFSSEYGDIRMDEAHGITNTTRVEPYSQIPAVQIDSNSKGHFIHTSIEREVLNTKANDVGYGSVISVTDNSKARFGGTSSKATLLLGPAGTAAKQKHLAGAYASNNSLIEFNGPTAVARFGVGAMAENKSTIKFCPPRGEVGNTLEASAYALATVGNHTSVELHATRACVLANKESSIIMEDLGDYHHYRDLGGGEYDYDTANLGTSSLTRAGSMQFYPNPNTIDGDEDDSHIVVNQSNGVLAHTNGTKSFTSTTKDTVAYNYGIVNPLGLSEANMKIKTKGGFCVRALNNSNVTVKNVHFLTGYANPSGIYYNASGGASSMLYMWNLADTSKLHATYCSVSGNDPSTLAWPTGGTAFYNGPSALYTSATAYGTTTHVGYKPALAAPSGTPHTGFLSVLDSFGHIDASISSLYSLGSLAIGKTYNTPFEYLALSGAQQDLSKNYGIVTDESHAVFAGIGSPLSDADHAHNLGPFRIYLSPDPACKQLYASKHGWAKPDLFPALDVATLAPHTTSGVYGIAHQVFAQGYNFSGALFAPSGLGNQGVPDYHTSSLYPKLLKLSRDADSDGINDSLTTSGFYYCSEFLENDPTQIVVDESGSNTFANVKNLTLGSSGRPKRATLIRTIAGDNRAGQGGEVEPANSNAGLGFTTANTFDLRGNE